MKTARQRRELLVLMVLSAVGGEARLKEGFKTLNVQGPFVALGELGKKLETVVRSDDQREYEQNQAKKIVNDFIPLGFQLWPAEYRLWAAAQIVKRLIATGWKPPQDEHVLSFIQSMYNLADSLMMKTAPSKQAVEFIVRAPDVLRAKHDLFK